MTVATLLRESVEPLPDVQHATLGPLVERLARARVVLLGGATLGTSECYRLRSTLTRELIVHADFTTVALASGEPEAWWLDQYVRTRTEPPLWPPPLGGFPSWIWRNRETFGFVRWLRSHNLEMRPDAHVGIYGVDHFDLYDSIASILEHFDQGAPEAARVARARYACTTPWVGDPAAFVEMTLPPELRRDERRVIAALRKRLERRQKIVSRGRQRYSALLNEEGALTDADAFFRRLYNGSVGAWCAREQKMFDALKRILAATDQEAKVVVWAHNADVGDASATSLGLRGEPSLGQLCRREFGDAAHLVGFGVLQGSVTAARHWGGPAESATLSPAHQESYEHLCQDTGHPAFILSLREAARPEVREELRAPRLQRAIGAVYRPETELASHYYQTSLPDQFDEYIWFDRGHATLPLP